MSLRDLIQISIVRDISETSQKHFKREDFFVMSQRHLKRDVFFVTSLRRPKNISRKMSFVWRLSDVSNISLKSCLFRDISKTSQKHLLQVFVIFQKYLTIMVSCDFRRITEILDKIDMGPLETPKKWNVFWEQWIFINQVCHEY